MINFLDYSPLFCVALLALWSFSIRQLNIAAQPYRLEFADKCEALLSRQDVPNDIKNHIRFALNTAFGMRWPLIVIIVISPILIPVMVLYSSRFSHFYKQRSIQNIEAKSLFNDFQRLHMIVNIARNPILSIMAVIEIMVIFSISVFVRVLIGGGIPRFTGAGAFILIVEEKSQSFLNRYYQPAH